MLFLLEALALMMGYAIISHYTRKRRRSLPPGPPGLPVIGNIMDLTTHEQWRRAVEWGKKYGDLIYLQVLGTPLVYLNSAEAVADLLDARGGIYSDRPNLTMASEMCGLKQLAPLTRYGPRFQSQRRLMHSVLSTSAIDAWQPAVVEETKRLLRQILEDPDNYASHIGRMAGSLVYRVMYGYQVLESEDPFIKSAEEFMVKSSSVITAGWVVDFFPILKHLPGTKWRKIAAGVRAKFDEWVEKPHEMFKSLPDSPAKRASFCGKLLLDESGTLSHESTEYENDVKWIATSVYGAGSDTTLIALKTMILAMVHYPEVLAKAHAQIDAVVGANRLPTFEDRAKLPYIDCIFKEVLRWGAAVPLTPPHVLTQDDTYRGYNLPRGSFCIANMWAILHDECLYHDPERFYPERFEEKMTPELEKLRDPFNYAFGFGRRHCPGMRFARQSVWYAMAGFIACFDVSPITDSNGIPILPELAFDSGAFRHPKPFMCNIRPRSTAAEALIRGATT